MRKNAFRLCSSLLLLLAVTFLISCSPLQASSLPLPTLMATVALPPPTSDRVLAPATYTPLPSRTLPEPWPTSTPAPTFTPGPTPTPDPYREFTVAHLAQRPYGGQLQIIETLEETNDFTRSLIAYTSDGLTIYGFMNQPPGPGPFPVALVLHGYIPPHKYQVQDYTARYADELAAAGYLVIHPNYRNFNPSDEGDDTFRVGYAVDVLNLIAIIREQGGRPGPLQQASANGVYLLGHSMGGGIALRVLTVTADVHAAVLYGAMSGDESLNYERISFWTSGQDGNEELATPDEDLQRISPIYHLDRIHAAVSIHHGTADGKVPPKWSDDLCQRLQALGKRVECFTYSGQPHIFSGQADRRLIERTLTLFEQSQ